MLHVSEVIWAEVLLPYYRGNAKNVEKLSSSCKYKNFSNGWDIKNLLKKIGVSCLIISTRTCIELSD